MAWEDLWWDINKEITELKLKKKFDAQLKKMDGQEKHRYRDTRDRWSYARDKVVKEYQEKKIKKS